MNGMDAITGKPLSGLRHLRQSIQNILTTPIGSRVMRRDYGSKLFELIDQPLNQPTLMEVYAATAQALRKWEPRFKLTRVQAFRAEETGKVLLDLEGIYKPDGLEITLEAVEI